MITIPGKYHVYVVTNILNNMRYIGFTSLNPPGKRYKRHIRIAFGSPNRRVYHSYFYRAVRKYEVKNFMFEVVFSTNNYKTALKKERKFVKLYNTRGPGGYNLTDGGEGPSITIRRKMGKANIGMTGKVHSPVTRKKMKEAAKKYWQDPKHREKRAEDSRKRWEDPECRKRMSRAHKLTQTQILQIHYAAGKVSLQQFSKLFGVSDSCIRRVVRLHNLALKQA